MRAIQIPIALSAFALGILVAQGASWLLHVGEPASALAGTNETMRPALSIGNQQAETPLAVTDSTLGQANSASPSPNTARESMTADSTVSARTAIDSEGSAMPVDLNAMIAKLYEENPEEFLGLLVDQFLENGEPLRALELLKESPNVNGYRFSQVGIALQKDGQVAAAIEAFTESTRIDPMNSDSFGPLMELDPSTALLLVREGLAWQPPPGNSEMRIRLAQALLAAGQEEEASKLVDELREGGVKATSLTNLYGKLSPDAAEAELRGSVETAVGKKKTRPLQKLAAMLEQAGRKDEALAAIDALLEINPNDGRARRLLAKLDAEASIELLAERTRAQPESSGLWSEYGNALEDQGRRVDAIAAWEQSLRLSGSTASFRKLLEHSPDTVWNNLQTFTQNSSNDERWGDFGDILWEHDRHDEAKRAWEKAWELDPSDSEWYGKLQAIQVNRDPLN